MNENQKLEVISVADTIKIIGCSRSTFYTTHNKKLKSEGKIGRKVYYSLEAIKEFSRALKEKTSNLKVVELNHHDIEVVSPEIVTPE